MGQWNSDCVRFYCVFFCFKLDPSYRYPGDLPTRQLGYCVKECIYYGFEHEFWRATMIDEWNLVCEKAWLKTLAKQLLFAGIGSNVNHIFENPCSGTIKLIFRIKCVCINSKM